MSTLPNIKKTNEQTLNDIQSLQQLEKQIFNNLETNPSISSEEQKKLLTKMNQLSNMRINLYRTLSGVNNYFQDALNTSVGSLKQQVSAIGIVESELNRAKKRLESLQQEKTDKIRLVEINTYYGDRYAEHSELMKIVIFTLVPIIILVFLNNKGILPNMVYIILLVIVSLIGSYFFLNRFVSIISRDNMNYQKYKWHFDPNKQPSVVGSTIESDPWLTGIDFGTCIGENCCSSGLVYDSTIDKCIPKPVNVKENAKGKTKESFINQVLTKTQPANYKIQYDLTEPEAFNTQH
jgi:hypothetical protein